MSVRVSGLKSDMATLMDVAWALMGDRMVGVDEGPEVRIKSAHHGVGWRYEVTIVFKEETLWSCPIWVMNPDNDFDVLEHAVRRFSEYLDSFADIPGILVPKVMGS